MVFSAVLTARSVPTPANSRRGLGGASVALHTHKMRLKVKGESLAPSSFDSWRLPASQRGANILCGPSRSFSPKKHAACHVDIQLCSFLYKTNWITFDALICSYIRLES